MYLKTKEIEYFTLISLMIKLILCQAKNLQTEWFSDDMVKRGISTLSGILLEVVSKIGFEFKIPSSPKGFAETRAAGPSSPAKRDFPPDPNSFVGRKPQAYGFRSRIWNSVPTKIRGQKTFLKWILIFIQFLFQFFLHFRKEVFFLLSLLGLNAFDFLRKLFLGFLKFLKLVL